VGLAVGVVAGSLNVVVVVSIMARVADSVEVMSILVDGV
jgi:hypothetical protein